MVGNTYGSVHKGRTMSEEQKIKMRKPKSETHKAALRKPKSITINMKIAAQNRMPPSEETKRKISESVKKTREQKFWSTRKVV